MSVIAGKHAFLELLRQEDVKFVFGNPGTTELSLMDAFAGETEIRYVLALHEGIAVAMAHGYAVASGKIACVNLHAAPGLGNALGMLYNAKKAGAPLLVTAGQHHTSITLSEPLLWDDLPVMARPHVKWAAQVETLRDLPRAVHRACKVALSPPTGPVFLSIPDNVLSESADIDLGAPTRVGIGIRADASEVARAAKILAESKSPMIFAGDAVSKGFAQGEVAALALIIGAPVYLEAMADAASFPASHPLFAGLVPRIGTPARKVLDQHDVIVSVGGDLFTLSLPSDTESIGPRARIVHLDNDAWELGKNYPTEVALLGEPKATLPELVAAVSEHGVVGAAARVEAITAANRARRKALVDKAEAASASSPIAPLALLHAIGKLLPSNAVVIEEILSSNPGLRDLVVRDDPQSFYGMRGGGIGMALPQAIGARLALPDRPVVALVGDGSSLYSIQALWTAMHEELPIIYVVFNNRSYRILKQRTQALGDVTAKTGKFVAMDFESPPLDFVSLARGFGMPATRVTTLAEFEARFSRALSEKRACLLDVAIDREL